MTRIISWLGRFRSKLDEGGRATRSETMALIELQLSAASAMENRATSEDEKKQVAERIRQLLIRKMMVAEVHLAPRLGDLPHLATDYSVETTARLVPAPQFPVGEPTSPQPSLGNVDTSQSTGSREITAPAEAGIVHRSFDLSEHSNIAPGLSALGLALSETGQNEAAYAVFQRLEDEQPGVSQWAHNSAVALDRSGRTTEAVEKYSRAIALGSPASATLAYRGAALVRVGRHEDAIADFRAYLEDQPGDPVATGNLATAFSNLGMYVEAIAQYDRALEIAPGRPATLYNKGTALLKMGKLTEAIECFTDSLAVRPTSAATLYNRGVAEDKLGLLGAALADLAAALSLSEDRSGLFESLADEADFAGLRSDPELGPVFDGLIRIK